MKNGKEIKNNCITIFYKPKELFVERIRLFGNKFVEKNRDKCKIIYKNKEYKLTEFFENIDNNYQDYENQINIKLRILNDIIDMSYMFYECHTLLSFIFLPENDRQNSNPKLNPIPSPEKSNSNSDSLEENEIKDMYYGCKKIPMKEDISSVHKSDTSNHIFKISSSDKNNSQSKYFDPMIIILSNVFKNCESLMLFTNESRMNFSNIKDKQDQRDKMPILSSFYSVKDEIISSKIEVNNNYKRNFLFSSLTNIKVTKMSYMFYGCKSLLSLPDISKWEYFKSYQYKLYVLWM